MIEIVYDPWDGTPVPDEQAFMFGDQVVQELLSHTDKQIAVKTVSTFLCLDSVRAKISSGDLSYGRDIVFVWNNKVVPVDHQGRILKWDEHFGDVFDLLIEKIFPLR